jgi:uncharacterized protein with PIN domain
VKFLADGMLGKLTRWLRMLGHDVEYSNNIADTELLALAKKENRVLLTKDLELYQRAIARGIDAFYLEGKTEAERLAELAKRYSLPLVVEMEKSFCPRCNTKLNAASKEQIKNDVEKNTYLYYDKFWKCPNCGHVYWQGAHWQQINKTLREANEKLKKKVEA